MNNLNAKKHIFKNSYSVCVSFTFFSIFAVDERILEKKILISKKSINTLLKNCWKCETWSYTYTHQQSSSSARWKIFNILNYRSFVKKKITQQFETAIIFHWIYEWFRKWLFIYAFWNITMQSWYSRGIEFLQTQRFLITNWFCCVGISVLWTFILRVSHKWKSKDEKKVMYYKHYMHLVLFCIKVKEGILTYIRICYISYSRYNFLTKHL